MTINRCITGLHPELQTIARDLTEKLAYAYETSFTETNFEIYETLRSVERQQYFIRVGIAEAGSIHYHPLVTGMGLSVLPFYNPLQAVALGVNPGYSWTPVSKADWSYLEIECLEAGLIRIAKHLYVLPEWVLKFEPNNYEI